MEYAKCWIFPYPVTCMYIYCTYTYMYMCAGGGGDGGVREEVGGAWNSRHPDRIHAKVNIYHNWRIPSKQQQWVHNDILQKLLYVHVYTLFMLNWHIHVHLTRNNFRQERGMVMGLVYSTALVKVAKSLALSNVKGCGEVPYQKPQLKSMAHGVYPY